jgi:hypothetical protein
MPYRAPGTAPRARRFRHNKLPACAGSQLLRRFRRRSRQTPRAVAGCATRRAASVGIVAGAQRSRCRTRTTEGRGSPCGVAVRLGGAWFPPHGRTRLLCCHGSSQWPRTRYGSPRHRRSSVMTGAGRSLCPVLRYKHVASHRFRELRYRVRSERPAALWPQFTWSRAPRAEQSGATGLGGPTGHGFLSAPGVMQNRWRHTDASIEFP